MDELAPMLVAVSLFFSVAAVLIFRPLSKRLGEVIGVLAQSRAAAAAPPRTDDAEAIRLRAAVEHLTARLELMEERLDFTERLVSSNRMTNGQAPLLRGERVGA